MKRKSDIVTSAGIIKDIRRLVRCPRSAAVRRAQRHYAVVIGVKKFPVKLGWQGTSAASDARGSKQSRELLANLCLVAQ